MGQVWVLYVNIEFSLINQIHVTFFPYLLCPRQFYLVIKLNDHTHFNICITLFHSQERRVRESKLPTGMCLINNRA